MSNIIIFDTYKDNRGKLSVVQNQIPFTIKRVFYIYDVDNSKRGFHRHKKTRQLVICVHGTCEFVIEKKGIDEVIFLDNPNKGILVEPEDYHWMQNFSKDAVLLVLASEPYDENDYIWSNDD